MHRFASKTFLACVLAGITTFTGCYGSFTLTKKVHTWNGQASDNKFVQWLVFLGLNVIPVYELAVVVDAFIANPLEFWTGDNPANGIATHVEKDANGTATITRGDEVFTAVPVASDKVEIFKDGQRIGVAAVADDGSLVVTDETGAVRLTKDSL